VTDPQAAGCPVAAAVARTVAAYGDHTAVVAGDGTLTYRDLWARAETWRYRFDGLAPGTVVGVVAGGQAELPAVFLGLRSAGLVPMLVDEMLPAARTGPVLAQARPAAVVRLASGAVSRAAGDARVTPAGTGYVVFSSGTQGAPKGIAGSARGLAHFLAWEAELLGVGPGTRVASLTSPSFDVILRDLLLPLVAGGRSVLAGSTVRMSPKAVLPWLAANPVDVLHVVPSLSARWVEASPGVTVPVGSTLSAGEPLHARHVARWRAVSPGTRLLNLYGPAETTLAAFWHEVPADPAPGVQPVGRPLPGAALDLEPVEGSDAHRVVISTPHGSLGYLGGTCGRADRARLRRAGGLTRFATQDRGRIDGGALVVDGRLDSLVKRNGSFVDTARIEVAAATLPGVGAACCVQVVPSGRIVLAVDGPAAGDGLRARLRDRLGMELPDEVRVLPALPLLAGGKVDRRSVRTLVEGAHA
jgi:D-alanine--poly(phosphoribitol) ligase subunit 1